MGTEACAMISAAESGECVDSPSTSASRTKKRSDRSAETIPAPNPARTATEKKTRVALLRLPIFF